MAQKASIGVPTAGDWFHYPAADTLATKTLAARADASWVVTGVTFGYDQAVAATQKFILASPAGSSHLEVPVRGAGLQTLLFDPPLRFPPGAAVNIQLAAGGAGIQGAVGFTGAYIE